MIIVIVLLLLIWRYLDFIQSSPRILQPPLHPAHFSCVSNIIIMTVITITVAIISIILGVLNG